MAQTSTSRRRWRCGLLTAGWLAAAAAAAQQLQNVQTEHRGLTLNATLRLAADSTPADGAVLITHGTLLANDSETVVAIAELLQQAGVNTLAHSLSYAIDDRRGRYDCAEPHRHRHADALDEIDVWLDWLERRGAARVALLGHSRGGNQVAWYGAERDRPSLRAVVMLGPSSRRYENVYIREHLHKLADARRLAEVERDTVSVLLASGFLYCEKALVTPSSFLSYYRPERRRDTPSLLPELAMPALVVAAGEDQIVPGLALDVVAVDDLELAVIDGADHFFRDLYADEAVDVIVDFLRRQAGLPTER